MNMIPRKRTNLNNGILSDRDMEKLKRQIMDQMKFVSYVGTVKRQEVTFTWDNVHYIHVAIDEHGNFLHVVAVYKVET
jgi:hypothetical protein